MATFFSLMIDELNRISEEMVVKIDYNILRRAENVWLNVRNLNLTSI